MAPAEKTRVAIIGAAGYAGGELLRLLVSHPRVEVVAAVSESQAGLPLSAAFPGMASLKLRFEKPDDALAERCDVVFLAQENGVAMKSVGTFLKAKKKVIDLSADFRLTDAKAYPLWYKHEHSSKELLATSVYGLPELHRKKIGSASLVANPGCYPTASILALAPLVEKKLIDLGSIVIDAKSGVSGAGRSKHTQEFMFSEINESVRAYGVGGTHRHTPEIEQELSLLSDSEIRLTFTPHLIPITRGILSTCYATPLKKIPSEELHELYATRYRGEPFVTVLETGQVPATKATYGSNRCHIGTIVDARTGRLIVVSAIDNLIKGAAGQAVQNLNIMCGFDEKEALNNPGIWP